MKETRSTNFRFIFILLVICFLKANSEISYLKYYESSHALIHVISSIRQNKLQQMDNQYTQKCTTTNDCCICNKIFKNTSYLELHMNLHHPIVEETPQDNMLMYVFDKKINSELRFQICSKYLTVLDLNQFYVKHQDLSHDQILWYQRNDSLFKKTLNQTEIVDACTIIAYGAYHEPLWRVWIKCTLIFAFAVVFLVYYASVIDEINEKYFPKKPKAKPKIPLIQ